jgi:hypothetical protein
MNIWELDYLSSTDEEDNEESSSEEENSDDSDAEGQAAYQNKRKKKKPKVMDIVDKLIQSQKELQKRDIEARVRKLKMRHLLRKRIAVHDEPIEDCENFKKWFKHEQVIKDNDIYFAMHCRHTTSYRQGD